MKFKYRKKPRYWKSAKDKDWKSCTSKQKDTLKVTAKGVFEFEEITKPKPTESMKKKEKETPLSTKE